MKDFFISYNKADRRWAEWIAWGLEEAGYSTVIQAWDFKPGGNFVLEMDNATKEAQQTLAVLSPDYLEAHYTHPEWAAAFAKDPGGEKRTLIPVRVRECDLSGLLHQIIYIDLVGLDEASAKERLLQKVSGERGKPSESPAFPGATERSVREQPRFPGVLWNVPLRCNPYFTGREERLVQLHETLLSDNTAALSQPQAITGLGGIGKTQTALEYACRHRAHYQAVLWVLADSQENLIAGFVAIARVLKLPEKEAQDQSEAVDAVKRWLATERGWLLILDNADELTLTHQFMPANPQGHLLLTTRAQALGKIARAISIDKMPVAEGTVLLLRRAGMLSADDQLDATPKQTREQAETLCGMLDGLPLALDQAGAYIEETKCGLAGYLALFRTHADQLLAERGQTGGSDHPDPVTTTWTLSFEKVKNAAPAAADLLRTCAFLHPEGIPEELFSESGETLGEPLQSAAEDPLEWNRTLKETLKYSLLQRDAENKTLSMHRLVQTVLKMAMDEATQSEWATRIVRAVSHAFPGGNFDYEEWPLCERLMPHVLVCAELIEQWVFEDSEASYLLNQAGHYLQGRARYAEAEPLMRRALAIDEASFGDDHPDVARDLNNLALLLKATNRLAEAEPLMRRVVAIYETSLGAEHPNVATALNNLALLLKATNRLAEAEPLSRQMVEILLLFTLRTGHEHPHLSAALENYTGLLEEMRLDEEEQQVEIESLIESVKSRISS